MGTPTLRQRLVASLMRCYPLYSGCGTVANQHWVQWLAGSSTEQVWAKVPGGEVSALLGDYAGRAAFYAGDLDRKITWLCGRLVRPGDTVLDIGTNIGMVTLRLAALVGPSGCVHSFEPNPALHEGLRETIERNRLKNVRLHPIALGSEEATLELCVPRYNTGTASLVRRRGGATSVMATVPVRPLSRVIEEEGIESIRLLKLDVEGFEAEVLKGGRDALERVRPEALLFELDERFAGKYRDEPSIRILRELDYEFLSIPRCLVRMQLERFDPETESAPVGHDILAVNRGGSYESIMGRLPVSANGPRR